MCLIPKAGIPHFALKYLLHMIVQIMLDSNNRSDYSPKGFILLLDSSVDR